MDNEDGVLAERGLRVRRGLAGLLGTSGGTVRRVAGAAFALIAVACPVGRALAQSVDCGRLEAAIRAGENDNGQQDNSGASRAAERQRYEIERTRRYAAQIGCGQQQAGLFGDSAPPECDDIRERMTQMQDNLDRMQGRAEQATGGDRAARQAALVQRYNAVCAGNPANLAQDAANFLQGVGRSLADLTTVPVNPDDLSSVPLNGDIIDDGGQSNHNAGHAICVRSCDGGYFPLAARASTDQLDGLDSLCKASCPNTEAHVYTMRNGEGLTSATAIDGTSYTALPSAFKFEKSYSPTCTCKPPNQSWAEALAGAEKMLSSGDRHDVTVTAAMSDQMAKPVSTPPGKGKAGREKPTQDPATAAVDRRVAAEGLRAAQAPTASNESAGIGGTAQGERVLGRSDGLRVTVAGPDGASKQIRLIVP